MPLFKTERLAARQLSQQDLPALTDILSDPEVMKYSIRGVCDETATRDFIDSCLESYAAHGFGPWALEERSSGELIGFCGIGLEPVGDVDEINLGYRLAQKFWNQGLATEATQGVLGYAFKQLHCESVIVIIEPEHRASIRVTEKAGFRNHTETEFHRRPVRLYRMSCDDWAKHQQGL